MPDYLVEWDIDIFDHPTPQDAAEKALRIQRNPNSIATIFRVTNTTTSEQTIVDLTEDKPSRSWVMGTFTNDTEEVDNR
jgi:hypothetical protein